MAKGDTNKNGRLVCCVLLLVWCLVAIDLPTGAAAGRARLWHSLAPSDKRHEASLHHHKASSPGPSPGFLPYHPPVLVLFEQVPEIVGMQVGGHKWRPVTPPSGPSSANKLGVPPYPSLSPPPPVLPFKHLKKGPVNPPSGPSSGDKPGIPPYPVLPSPPIIPINHINKGPVLGPSGPSSGNEPGMPPLPRLTPPPVLV